IIGRRAGLAELVDELDALILDLGGKAFLIVAQAVGGIHKRGALLAETVFDRLDLFGHAAACGFQTLGLARQVVGGKAGGVLGFVGGGSQIGGAGGEGGFGFAKLGLSEVGG